MEEARGPTYLKSAGMALYQRGSSPTRKLAEAVGLSRAMAYRVVEVLLRYGIIEQINAGRVPLYCLSKNPTVRQMAELLVKMDEAMRAGA